MKHSIILIIALCIVFWIFIPPQVQTLTIYKLSCPDVASNEETCPAKHEPAKFGYKIFLEEQFIVSQDTLRRYNECIIYDRRNWACNSDKIVINVTNGKETIYPREDAHPNDKSYDDANETLKNEMSRNPQINIIQYYVRKARALAGR